MILAIKNKNELFIRSDELLKEATIEIENGFGIKTKQNCKNLDFKKISVKNHQGKFILRIKNNHKTIYQKTFTN